MARASREERMAELDMKMAQLAAQKKQLARQAQRERRKQQERTWIRIGRGMAALGVDSELKWAELRKLIVGNPNWQDWIRKINAETRDDTPSSETLMDVEI